MKWLTRKTAPQVEPDDLCTCDVFDMGPRCNACVRVCLKSGHVIGHHASGHPDYCFCGAPGGQYDAEALSDGAA